MWNKRCETGLVVVRTITWIVTPTCFEHFWKFQTCKFCGFVSNVFSQSVQPTMKKKQSVFSLVKKRLTRAWIIPIPKTTNTACQHLKPRGGPKGRNCLCHFVIECLQRSSELSFWSEKHVFASEPKTVLVKLTCFLGWGGVGKKHLWCYMMLPWWGGVGKKRPWCEFSTTLLTIQEHSVLFLCCCLAEQYGRAAPCVFST